eukprot:CAMPEP_0206623564 /NCGR_PEP_ID=MMETSP0325_2-20121206/63551_1 /ASSEMBLY_ACC=CAM_ASM_000347 /TAXON_ID=2866 /ORGANISM="Crypthecodinium cohnii, Strain Seligo" /LENGTH=36 /DNA_ID= /DNA_START= /DNA_END= /DNA_ORIENTATION=
MTWLRPGPSGECEGWVCVYAGVGLCVRVPAESVLSA